MKNSSKLLIAVISTVLLLILSGVVIAGNLDTSDNEDKEYNTLAGEDYFGTGSVEDTTEDGTYESETSVEIETSVVEEYTEVVTEEESITEAVISTELVDETETQDKVLIDASYRVKVAEADWSDWFISGSEMLLSDMTEGFEISVDVSGIDVVVSVYDAAKGWSTGSIGGYTYLGDELISAVKLELAGELSDSYDVYYSVLIGSDIWTDYVSNGEVASDLSGNEIKGLRIYVEERETEVETVEAVTEAQTELTTEIVEATTESIIETVEETTEITEITTEVQIETTETATEVQVETIEAVTEAQIVEVTTEAVEETTEEEEIIEDTTVESVTEAQETEAAVKAETEDVYEGSFHIKTEEDDRDILLVEEEGAAYYDITQSVLKPICAVFDFPNTYINKGDIMKDMIEIAATQVGYHRDEYTETKYGIWYGYPSSAWCAMFVSWCADQAGVDADIIKPFCRCATEATWFKGQDKWQNPAKYTPVEGDIMFFNYNGSRINHVGIVTGVKDGYVYCIEGNHADSVDITRHKLTASYITGYGTPQYKDNGVEDTAKVKYSVHVQSYGWLDYVLEGEMAGTTGEYRRMEAIMIELDDNLGIDGGISYRVHVRSYGWMPWMSDGEMAGTTGEYRRMEAIEIVLTGEIEKYYDVYYRVHSRTYGWLDYAKNGEMAGTSGLYKRMEAIEIVLVKKGDAAPGCTEVPFYIGES